MNEKYNAVSIYRSVIISALKGGMSMAHINVLFVGQ